jgi:hypothetical protein
VLLVSRTGWTWIALPIKWLLSFVFQAADLANAWKFSIFISAEWAKWAFSLLLISIGALTYQLIKKK